MTTACLIGQEDYSAEAIVEAPSRAVVIPKAIFEEAMARSAAFRRFVFAGFSARLNDLFHLVEDIAFARMDIRLAHKLLELAPLGQEITITQQQLAAELGSAREVVSRMLSELQRRGWLKVARGHITLLNRTALETLSAEK